MSIGKVLTHLRTAVMYNMAAMLREDNKTEFQRLLTNSEAGDRVTNRGVII